MESTTNSLSYKKYVLQNHHHDYLLASLEIPHRAGNRRLWLRNSTAGSSPTVAHFWSFVKNSTEIETEGLLASPCVRRGHLQERHQEECEHPNAPLQVPWLRHPSPKFFWDPDMEINSTPSPIDLKKCFGSLIQRIGWVGDMASRLNLRANETCPQVASINYNKENKLDSPHFSHWPYWRLSQTST